MSKLRVLSLFSGIGSFEKALTNIGINYEVVGFSEIDKWAIESYSAIHGINTELNLGDAKEVEVESVPDADLITYGFPCTSVTNNGLREGIEEGTESGLLLEAERIISHIKPRYAIAENVKNLVGKTYKEDFDRLLERLDGYGYNNYWSVLNSLDYGIPQRRERVFIVSIRKDIDDGTFEFPSTREKSKELKDYLLDSVDEKYNVDSGQARELFGDIGGNPPTVSVRVANVKGYDIVEVGDSVNISFPASKTRRGRVGKGVAQTVETQATLATLSEKDRVVRKLTPQENWRLMGFEDKDYWTARERLESKFYNGKDRSNSQMYKQAGNGIVVDVLEDIFRELLGGCSFEKNEST